jgi:hypothetical protein
MSSSTPSIHCVLLSSTALTMLPCPHIQRISPLRVRNWNSSTKGVPASAACCTMAAMRLTSSGATSLAKLMSGGEPRKAEVGQPVMRSAASLM